MPDREAILGWYFVIKSTVIGILVVLVLYIIGANLLNWLIPGTVARPFPLKFFF